MEPEIIEQFLVRSVLSTRFPDKMAFIDYSMGQSGKNNFVNWLKRIAKLVPFCWIKMSKMQFRANLKSIMPKSLPL